MNKEKHVDLSTPGTQAETRGWEYNWIGEFGEKDNFRWDKVNDTGLCLLIYNEHPSLRKLFMAKT